MTTPSEHIAKARRELASGRHALAGAFGDSAGRDAYLASFQAALAYIVHRTTKVPKTHRGTRSEFARLARDEPRIDRRFSAFLADAYELKQWADYDGDVPISFSNAESAPSIAAEMVDAIERLLP